MIATLHMLARLDADMDNGTVVVMQVLKGIKVTIDTELPPGVYRGEITTSAQMDGGIFSSKLTSATLVLDTDVLESIGLDVDEAGQSELRVPVVEHVESGDITFDTN